MWKYKCILPPTRHVRPHCSMFLPTFDIIKLLAGATLKWWNTGFSLWRFLFWQSTGSRRAGFVAPQLVESSQNRDRTMSPTLAGRVSTIGSPEKSCLSHLGLQSLRDGFCVWFEVGIKTLSTLLPSLLPSLFFHLRIFNCYSTIYLKRHLSLLFYNGSSVKKWYFMYKSVSGFFP